MEGSSPQQKRLKTLEARALQLLEKLARFEKQKDMETRVEEVMRLEELIKNTHSDLHVVYEKIATIKISILIQQANRLKSNQNYSKAIQRWRDVKALQLDHPLVAEAIDELQRAKKAFEAAQKPIRTLARHFQALEPIWSELLDRLKRDHLKPDFETLVDVTNDYCDGKMEAEAFIRWYKSAIQNALREPQTLSNLAAIVRRIKQGEMVLFLGSDIAKHYHDEHLDEQEIAQQLALQANYKDFNGPLASIAEYYQAQVGIGTSELLRCLQQHLPKDKQMIELYYQLGQTKVPQILITTVYDDLLEQMFLAANKPFVKLSAFIYESEQYRIGDVHVHYSDQLHKDKIMMSEELSKMEFTQEGYSIIYKMRGTCCDDSKVIQRDTLMVAERHFFDFARYAHRIIPNNLNHEIRKRGFLFVGYRPRSWDDRLLVKVLLAKRQNADESCYVLTTTSEPLEDAHWRQHHVERYPFDLADLDECFSRSV